MSKFLNYFNRIYFEKTQQKIKVIASQHELLKLLASGMTLKEIAAKTNKKYFNIQKRTQKLYEKFQVKNRPELIRKAIAENILTRKDVKTKFKKRFSSTTPQIEEIKLYEPLSNRSKIYLELKALGKTDNEIIQLMGLYGTYPIWEIRRELFYKLDCKNMIEVIHKAFKLEII